MSWPPYDGYSPALFSAVCTACPHINKQILLAGCIHSQSNVGRNIKQSWRVPECILDHFTLFSAVCTCTLCYQPTCSSCLFKSFLLLQADRTIHYLCFLYSDTGPYQITNVWLVFLQNFLMLVGGRIKFSWHSYT